MYFCMANHPTTATRCLLPEIKSLRSSRIKASLFSIALLISTNVAPSGEVNVLDKESASSQSSRLILPSLNSRTSWRNFHIGSSLFEMLKDLSRREQFPSELINVKAPSFDSKPSGATRTFSSSVPLNVASLGSISLLISRRHHASATWANYQILSGEKGRNG
jgi:hypothetical protein